MAPRNLISFIVAHYGLLWPNLAGLSSLMPILVDCGSLWLNLSY